MASAMIKSTYSLDPETVRKVERLATRWKVSKSEVLRRAVAAAKEEPSLAPPPPEPTIESRLEALCKLQEHMNLTPQQARAWEKDSRQIRRNMFRSGR
jgi:hypothetical protein